MKTKVTALLLVSFFMVKADEDPCSETRLFVAAVQGHFGTNGAPSKFLAGCKKKRDDEYAKKKAAFQKEKEKAEQERDETQGEGLYRDLNYELTLASICQRETPIDEEHQSDEYFDRAIKSLARSAADEVKEALLNKDEDDQINLHLTGPYSLPNLSVGARSYLASRVMDKIDPEEFQKVIRSIKEGSSDIDLRPLITLLEERFRSEYRKRGPYYSCFTPGAFWFWLGSEEANK